MELALTWICSPDLYFEEEASCWGRTEEARKRGHAELVLRTGSEVEIKTLRLLLPGVEYDEHVNLSVSLKEPT